MKWTTKAKILSVLSILPPQFSYETHYWMQKKFGGLRRINPNSRLLAGIEICNLILKQGHTHKNGVFLEVGTGRRLNVPLALWLLGAGKVTTVDLNPYLKYELIVEDLEYIKCNRDEIFRLFNHNSFMNERFNRLIDFDCRKSKLNDFLKMCSIEYIAPGDAANLDLPSKSVDFHISNSVLEHIPEDILKDILIEGNRIIKDDGLFIHRIDCSDHFSHDDKSISSINFLQYSDQEWAKYAENRYAYTNRLRVDDIEELYQKCGHKILISESETNKEAQELLETSSIKLDDRFKGRSTIILSTTSSWIVSSNSA